MLLLDGPLTLREHMSHEELPLATLFREVFEFIRSREDAVLFGAHAVNVYCTPERMTQDVDVLSTHGAAFAEDLRAHLGAKFHVAVRVREVRAGGGGLGFRVYQVRSPKNRHLVDVRHVSEFPPCETVEGIRVVTPGELVAMKVMAVGRRGQRPKGGTDTADLRRLLLTFPALRAEDSGVETRIRELGGAEKDVAAWHEWVSADLQPDEEEEDP